MKNHKKTVSVLIMVALFAGMMLNVSANQEKSLVWTLKPFPSNIVDVEYAYIDQWGLTDYKQGEGAGIIDRYGNAVVEHRYDKFSALSSELLAVTKDDKCGVINRDGDVLIECKYYSITKLNDELLVAGIENTDNQKSPDCSVIINLKGEEVLAPEYDLLVPLNENLLMAEKGFKYGVIDKTGKIIVPIEYDSRFELIHDKYLASATSNRPTAVVADLKGKILIDDETISSVKESYDDNIVITYSENKGTASAVYNEKYFDIDLKEIDTKGYSVQELNDKYLIAKKKDDSAYGSYFCGIVDRSFNTVVPFKYKSMTRISDNIIHAYIELSDGVKEGVAEYINCEGERLHWLDKFSWIYSPCKGYIAALTNVPGSSYADVCELYDEQGNQLASAQYTAIRYVDEGVFAFRTISGRVGLAEFAESGDKVLDYVNGIVLKIGETKATVYGENKENDVAPIIRGGRTMLPARFVAESLGATVSWNAEAQQVIIQPQDVMDGQIVLTIGSTEAKYGRYGGTEILDVAPFIENGRTYTPVRFIAEKLRAEVLWNPETRTVTIKK